MGTTRTPHYTVQITTADGAQTPMEWRVRARMTLNGPCPAVHGQPTKENLKTFVERFEAATQPGGVNAHVGPQIVKTAFIRDQRTGEIKATYKKASCCIQCEQNPAQPLDRGVTDFCSRKCADRYLTGNSP